MTGLAAAHGWTTMSWACLLSHDLRGKCQSLSTRHDELHAIRIPSYSTALNKCLRVSTRYLEIVNLGVAAIRDEQPIGGITTEHIHAGNLLLKRKR